MSAPFEWISVRMFVKQREKVRMTVRNGYTCCINNVRNKTERKIWSPFVPISMQWLRCFVFYSNPLCITMCSIVCASDWVFHCWIFGTLLKIVYTLFHLFILSFFPRSECTINCYSIRSPGQNNWLSYRGVSFCRVRRVISDCVNMMMSWCLLLDTWCCMDLNNSAAHTLIYSEYQTVRMIFVLFSR